MIQIPLSSIDGDISGFAAALEAHRGAVEAHMMGKPGVPAPRAHPLIAALVTRVPDVGPVADRGPDKIVIAEHEILDDTPPAPVDAGVELALQTLRATISG